MNEMTRHGRRYRLYLALLLGLALALALAVSAAHTEARARDSALLPSDTATPTATPQTCQSGVITVNIQNFAFNPANITVCAGSEVKWTNSDSFQHTATSDTGVWNSGSLGNGNSFTFRFDTPGVYPYHCAFHTHMTGSITVVEPTSATATPTDTSTPAPSPTAAQATVTPTDTSTPAPSPTPPLSSPTLTPTATQACQSGVVTVSIQNFAFTPASVTVCAGSQVKWTNNDPFPHTSTSDTVVWDSGTLNGGDSFTFRFDTPGVYAYHCAIHTHMQGTITVVAGPPSAYSIYLPHIARAQ